MKSNIRNLARFLKARKRRPKHKGNDYWAKIDAAPAKIDGQPTVLHVGFTPRGAYWPAGPLKNICVDAR